MKTQKQLINNIIGQLNGINKMIEEEKECFSVIIQMKAIKSALNNLMTKYINDNAANCLNSCQNKKDKDANLKKLILELVKNT